MGASVGGAKAINARRGRRGSRHGTISEINVTPLVDVMLVLLIVFMVAAPLMTVGVPVELPKTEAKSMDAPKEPLYLGSEKEPDGLSHGNANPAGKFGGEAWRTRQERQ